MKKYIFLTLLVMVMTVTVSAQRATHGVWTQNPDGVQLDDPDLPCVYTTYTKFRMISSWTEPTPGVPAEAHFRGALVTNVFHPCGAHFYEFILNQSSATTNDTIDGLWDVYRDGTLMCSACTGQASGLSQPVTGTYKLTVDDPVYGPAAWFYSGRVSVREDF